MKESGVRSQESEGEAFAYLDAELLKVMIEMFVHTGSPFTRCHLSKKGMRSLANSILLSLESGNEFGQVILFFIEVPVVSNKK